MSRIVTLYCLLSLLSCVGKQSKVELPIARELVVAVLADVRVAEEMKKPFKGEARDSAMLVYMDSIYVIHDIDSSQFANVIEVLEDNPKLFESVEVEVHAKLKSLLDTEDL